MSDGYAAVSEVLNLFAEQLQGLAVMLHRLDAKISAPVEIIRDASNRAIGVRKAGQIHAIEKNPDGTIAGSRLLSAPPSMAALSDQSSADK